MKRDLSSLKHLFLAGEPLDETTHRWIHEALGVPVIDNYWQTESGWPILALCRGVQEDLPIKYGSLGSAGLRLRPARLSRRRHRVRPQRKRHRRHRAAAASRLSGHRLGAGRALRVDLFQPLPRAGGLFHRRLGHQGRERLPTILGRIDDVINVAGHRLGTREIEEAIQANPAIAEVAVVGVHDEVKGQVPVAFAVVKDRLRIATREARRALEEEVKKTVDELPRRDRASTPRLFRAGAAQDAFGQDAAPLAAGARRRARPRRSSHHRGRPYPR